MGLYKVGYMLETLDRAMNFRETINTMTLENLRQGFDYSQPSENVGDRDNQQERLVRLTRLAMALECEGHLTIGMAPASKTRDRISLYPTIGFTNTDPYLVSEVASLLESEMVAFVLRRSDGRGAGKKQRFDLSVHGYKRVIRFLDLVQPHLVHKLNQAKLLRSFVQSRLAQPPKAEYSESDWNLCFQIRLLNRRLPNVKALAKAKVLLESPESIRQPRKRQYLEAYVKMCADLQRELERTAETTVPPILTKWVSK